MVLCTQAKCTVTKKQTEQDQSQPCRGAVCWGWGAGQRYLGLIGQDPVALFTALLFVSTGLLWWVTRNTWKHAQESNERQLRAYVCVDGASISLVNVGEVPKITVKTKNVGQTPAYGYCQQGQITFGPFPFIGTIEKQIRFVDAPLRDIGSGGEGGPTTNLERALTEQDIADIKDKKAAVFMYVAIFYRDVFGKERETHATLYWGGDMGHRNDGALYSLNKGLNYST